MLNSFSKKLSLLIFAFVLSLIFILTNTPLNKLSDKYLQAESLGGLFSYQAQNAYLNYEGKKLDLPQFYLAQNIYYFKNGDFQQNLPDNKSQVLWQDNQTINNIASSLIKNSNDFINAYFNTNELDPKNTEKINTLEDQLNIILPGFNLNQQGNFSGELKLNQASNKWAIAKTSMDTDKLKISYQVKDGEYWFIFESPLIYELNGQTYQDIKNINTGLKADQEVLIQGNSNLSMILKPQITDTVFLGEYPLAVLNNLTVYQDKQIIAQESFESLDNLILRDCSGEQGQALISLTNKPDATDGKSSIELKAKNHQACLNIKFKINQENSDVIYKISFDYKNIQGGQANSHILLNNQSNKQNDFIVNDNDWHHFQTLIAAKPEEQNLAIYFYAKSGGFKQVSNLYDNLIITEMQAAQPLILDDLFIGHSYIISNAIDLKTDNAFSIKLPDQQSEDSEQANKQFYFLQQNQAAVPATSNLEYKKIFNGLYRLQLKNIQQPVLLVFTRPYQSGWQANLGINKLAEQTHLSVNGYVNGWWLDPQQICSSSNSCHQNESNSYDLDLFLWHQPQLLYYLLLVIDLATFLFLLIILIKRRINTIYAPKN